ncbi:MAG: DUF5947 family protein [Candidatus Solibacter sp.]
MTDVDATVAQIEGMLDAHPESVGLVQALMELYGAALERILDRCPTDARDELGRDKLVGSLLALHGLHSVNTETRLRRALQRLERTYDGQRVILRSLDNGVAQIEVEHQGQGSPPISLAEAIEKAAWEAAPELDGVMVRGAQPMQASDLVQIAAPAPSPPSQERCEFCGAAMSEAHSHVVDLEGRRLMCSCRPCFLLFENPAAAGGRYRAVNGRYQRLAGAALDWDALETPVGMAFFIRSSKTGAVTAFYPSPAGATESALPVDSAEPTLQQLEPEVEALLLYRRDTALESWIVPVDACYELVGRIRRRWRGFDGGTEARTEIENFFTGLSAGRGATCST